MKRKPHYLIWSFIITLLIAAFILWPLNISAVNLTSAARVLYVSADGNDNNEGTLNMPFKTIQYGIDKMMPGETLIIRAGVYYENVNIEKKQGTKNAKFHIKAAEGEAVVLDGNGYEGNPVDGKLRGEEVIGIIDSSNILIEGLDIRNRKAVSADSLPMGILIGGSSKSITIKNNKIHDIWNVSKKIRTGNAHGILVLSQDKKPMTNINIIGNEIFNCRLGSSECVSFRGNIDGFKAIGNNIHDNDNIGIDANGYYGASKTLDYTRNGVISDNIISGIDSGKNPAYDYVKAAAGIYSDGSRDLIIERNIVKNCNVGIQVASENSGGNSINVTVRNNLVFYNELWGIGLGSAGREYGGAKNCKIINNKLVGNDSEYSTFGEISLGSNISKCEITNNTVRASDQGIFLSTYDKKIDIIINRNMYSTSKAENLTLWRIKGPDIEGFHKYRKITKWDLNSTMSKPTRNGYFSMNGFVLRVYEE